MTTGPAVDRRFQLVEQVPFGVHVVGTGDTDPWSITPDEMHALVARYRVVVLRGFRRLVDEAFPRWSARLGQPLRWEFGEVNELRVDAGKKNYLYTTSEVPLHWDGAFAGAIPRYIVFQCRDAPDQNSGGETTFVDTVGFVRDANDESHERWRHTTCSYTTEKVVHYGGSITQPLLDTHPITGEETLRFAEPVHDLNPVTVEVEGLDAIESARTVEAMASELNAGPHLLEHSWEAGDIVVADNHALLHGRRPFSPGSRRHLERVNILGPGSEAAAPQRTATDRRHRVRGIARDLLRIRRVEFVLAEIPIIALPLVVAGASWNVVRTGPFWVLVALFFLLFNFGDMINCLADRELDSIYKTHLASAVNRLGVASVRIQIAVSALGALALASYLSATLSRALFVPLVAVGLALGAGYSLPPVRFKGRGVLQLVCLWAIIFVGPMMLVSLLVSDRPSIAVLAVAATYGATQMGIILVNTAEDFPEDEAMRVRTIIVALGAARGLRLAARLIAIGGVSLVAVLGAWAIASGAVPAALLVLVPVVVVVERIRRSVDALAARVAVADLGTAATEVKVAGRAVPMWIAAVAWSTLGAAIVLRVAS